MHNISFYIVILLVFIFTCSNSLAEEGENNFLNRHLRYNEVFQSEISLFGGDYLGDETTNSWGVGGRYYLNLNDYLAVGAEYLYSPIYVDKNTELGKSLKTKKQHLVTSQAMISNECAFRVDHTTIECDLYLTLGVGSIWINGFYKPLGIIGGGMKIYTGAPWLVLRMDVNSYIHPTPKPSGDKINGDMAFFLGTSFLFPIKTINAEPDQN